ncbi:MAG TPA: hypothetical protein VGB43_05780 [Flavobacterium sp.]
MRYDQEYGFSIGKLSFVASFSQEESGVYFMVDSIKAGRGPSQKDFVEIASVNILKDGAAVAFWGQEDVKQVLIMETKPFAKQRHWKLFKKHFPQFERYVPNPQLDQHIVYVLNGTLLDKNYLKYLTVVTEKNLVSIEVIEAPELQEKYSITDKTFGVSIKTSAR